MFFLNNGTYSIRQIYIETVLYVSYMFRALSVYTDKSIIEKVYSPELVKGASLKDVTCQWVVINRSEQPLVDVQLDT